MQKTCCGNCIEYSAGRCYAMLPPWATLYDEFKKRPNVKPDDGEHCEMFSEVYLGH